MRHTFLAVAAALILAAPCAGAVVVLNPVDTIYVPARSIAVTGTQSRDLVGIIYSRDNLYFNEPGAPRFLFFDKEGKIAFGIGGSVKGTAHYDFNGAIGEGPDFTTYDIPVPADPANRQALGADLSHSSIYLRLVGRTTRFGYYSAFLQTNFTGDAPGKYGFLLKQAYMTLGPWLGGLTNSTFVDVAAAPPTIEEEGPCGQISVKQIMVRYAPRLDDHWSLGLAVEIPKNTFTTNSHNERIAQRVPDIPAYVQYRWGGGNSHVRLSGLVRTMSYRNLLEQKNHFANGWGAQLSGMAELVPGLTLMYQAAYGAGISSYVNDLGGNGLDLISPDADSGRMTAPHSLGLLGGLQYDWGKLTVSGSWSLCRLYDQGDMGPTTYKYANYVTANVFYNPLSDFQVGVEYNWGMRKDMDGTSGHANRISVLAQYSF